MENKMQEIKNKYKTFQQNYNKKSYNDYAKFIVGFKTIKHAIYKLPNAISEKKSEKQNNNENQLYNNHSLFDYIEDPTFNYNDEVERVSKKIEQKVDIINKKVKKIRQKMNPIYWIKLVIEKFRKKDTKLLPEGKNYENEVDNKSNFKEKRKMFIDSLSVSNTTDNINQKDINSNIEHLDYKDKTDIER